MSFDTRPPDRGFDTGALAGGIIFTVLGVLFLLEAAGVFDLRPALLWPVLLIGFGIAVILGGRSIGGKRPE